MSYIDNLLAFKVLYMLVTPFDKTDAFRSGVIDANGKVLVKPQDRSTEQRDSYNALNRVVFSLKRLLAKIPGGNTQIATLAAAYYLVKESHDSGDVLSRRKLEQTINEVVEKESSFGHELETVKAFMSVYEELGAIANVTGPAVSTDVPTILGKKNKKSMLKRADPLKIIGSK